MSSTPRASVIMPIYNGERYLEPAIESVLRQTFDDFELLLLNDGSTDRSVEIIEQYLKQDGRCKLHSWSNRGVVRTRNDGIDLARGEFLINLDCDDICLPQRFEKQIAYLGSHPDCVAVGSRILLIDTEGLPICEFINELTHDEIDSKHLSGVGGSRICNPSATMRREAVVRAGKYREGYAPSEDLDLFLRLAEIGMLANLPEVLIQYRQHPNSLGYVYRDKQWSNAKKAVEAARIRRKMVSLPDPLESAAEPQTIADAHRKWAWWALSAGNLHTARKHSIKALAMDPFNIENLRVVVYSIRGH